MMTIFTKMTLTPVIILLFLLFTASTDGKKNHSKKIKPEITASIQAKFSKIMISHNLQNSKFGFIEDRPLLPKEIAGLVRDEVRLRLPNFFKGIYRSAAGNSEQESPLIISLRYGKEAQKSFHEFIDVMSEKGNPSTAFTSNDFEIFYRNGPKGINVLTFPGNFVVSMKLQGAPFDVSQKGQIQEEIKKVLQELDLKHLAALSSSAEAAGTQANLTSFIDEYKYIPVDQDTLATFLPTELEKRTQSGHWGYKMGPRSEWQATYTGAGVEPIDLKIADIKFLSEKALENDYSWLLKNRDNTVFLGQKASGIYEGKNQAQSFQILVAERFIVEATGKGVSPKTLKNAIKQVDLEALAAVSE